MPKIKRPGNAVEVLQTVAKGLQPTHHPTLVKFGVPRDPFKVFH